MNNLAPSSAEAVIQIGKEAIDAYKQLPPQIQIFLAGAALVTFMTVAAMKLARDGG